MSFETACFSMYSDMSKRTSDFWFSKRNSASRRATSVLPTPEGPRKMKEPIGRFGLLTPRRERRIAFETPMIAASWPTIRRRSASSMWRSFSASSISSEATGMPVQEEMISSMSRRVTSCVASLRSADCALVRSISSFSSISRSRRKTAFSKSLSEIAFFISLTIWRISSSSLRRFCVSATRFSFTLAPASSRMSIALSGKKRSVM